MTADNSFDAMFSGVIGRDYQLLKLICPAATEMSRLVGLEVGEYCKSKSEPQSVLELGGGTGITTLAILSADECLKVISVDNETNMQNQAKQSLQAWMEQERLVFSADDALTALKNLGDAVIDIVASAYTLHNFEADYRRQVLREIFRVLKPSGLFVNGDRYALDAVSDHTRNTQHEIAGYFKVLTEIDRIDLLEQWIIHLFNDESENHIMRESVALQQLAGAGFCQIALKVRDGVNALLVAEKH
jgi:tRNA (cmo5U34)-methyltransferase